MTQAPPDRPVVYPETDGRPMPDGEYQSVTWRYLVAALKNHFRGRGVYAAGDTLRGPSIRSDVLGLELCLDGERLRFFDPAGERFLRSYEEAEARIAELEQALTARDGG